FWLFEQLTPGTGAYNEAWALRLRGRLDRAALATSIAQVVGRHEALRTTLVAQGGVPVQRVGHTVPALVVVDLSQLPEPERCSAFARRAEEAVREPFDLAAGPLLRTTLLQLGPDEHVLVCTAHHAVIDGWSVGVFIEELGALYVA